MASLASIFGMEGIQSASPSFTAIDLFFGRNAIMLNDVAQIFGSGVPIPIPIVGFEYRVPDEVELMRYKASRYPSLSKQTIINSLTKETTSFTITAIRPITKYNTALTNYALNELLLKALDWYNANGGTYTILTMWGILKPCIAEACYGVKLGDGDVGGQGWRFNFTKLNIQSTLTTQQSSFLDSLSGSV